MGNADLLRLIERMLQDQGDDSGTTLSARESRSLTDEIDSLKTGMASRNEIGQAQGIIMERHGVTAQAAFAVLVRLSQHTNRKLVDLARDLALTGELPDDPADEPPA